MPISKSYLKTKPACKITFTVPAKDAKSVVVAGDFNDWNEEDFKLKKAKNGDFKGSVTLPSKSEIRFRYLIDGEWANEAEADRSEWNEFAAAENSILEL